ILHVELNFNPGNLATLEIDIHGAGYEKEDRRIALSRQLLERLSAVPGAVSAAHTSELPVTCNCDSAELRALGHPWRGEHDSALRRETSTAYFQVLQARLLSGRFYTETDDASKPPVAVINRTLARRYFPDEDPVGKIIGDRELSPQSLTRIVGVVDDI